VSVVWGPNKKDLIRTDSKNLKTLYKMTSNTSCNKFRSLDVDKYSEDIYKEDQDVTESDQYIENCNIDNQSEIEALLSAGNAAEALNHVLGKTALGIKDPESREANQAAAVKVLLAIKTSQIEGAVAELDNEYRDILMKIIYRGFENPSEGSSGHLLMWHEKVFAVSGVGSIVRVLTDKKTV